MSRVELRKNLKDLLSRGECLLVSRDGKVFKVPPGFEMPRKDYQLGRGVDIFPDLAGQHVLEERIAELQRERVSLAAEVRRLNADDKKRFPFIFKVTSSYEQVLSGFDANFNKFYELSKQVQKIDPTIVVEPVINIKVLDTHDGIGYSMIAATKTFPCYFYIDADDNKNNGLPFKLGIELKISRGPIKRISIGKPYFLGYTSLVDYTYSHVGVIGNTSQLCAPNYRAYVESLRSLSLAQRIIMALDYARSTVHTSIRSGGVSADESAIVNAGVRSGHG